MVIATNFLVFREEGHDEVFARRLSIDCDSVEQACAMPFMEDKRKFQTVQNRLQEMKYVVIDSVKWILCDTYHDSLSRYTS